MVLCMHSSNGNKNTDWDYYLSIKKIYEEQLPRAMVSLQFLEEVLKQVIAEKGKILKHLVKGEMYYQPKNRGELEDLPLGRLIQEYGRFVDDSDFIRKLKELNKKRTRIAHKGFLDSQQLVPKESVNWVRKRTGEIEESNKMLQSVLINANLYIVKIQTEFSNTHIEKQ